MYYYITLCRFVNLCFLHSANHFYPLSFLMALYMLQLILFYAGLSNLCMAFQENLCRKLCT